MEQERRLIDANALIRVCEWAKTENEPSEDCVTALDLCIELFKQAPTVDAREVVHGEWEYGKWDQGHWVQGNERCRCSVCHRDFAVDNANIWHGCPHCLAKMDGGK